ncbi:MAG TPA: penicillin-binding protein [Chitinophagaceae bacterium]
MEVKRDISWRAYLAFISVVLTCAAIFSKAFYIQQVQGNYWRSMSDSLHLKIQEVDADRGTIYSADEEMLSTSIPQFDIYIDFEADGLRENNGERFHKNIDSLSYCLADLFKDRSTAEYKKILNNGYKSHDRYYLLKRKVGFEEYKQLRRFPLVRLGKNTSGFIAEVRSVRLNPYQLLAYRTIGLDRQNAQKVGLEQTYDTLLKGTTGQRLVRYIAGGVAVPVEDDYQVEPENGKDIVTTIDTRIQEITENALMKMMKSNEAEHGCALVMEVKTGAIKAIANLGRRPDGTYWEDFNYAMTPTEPGSTFKLATLLSVLEDKKFALNSTVDLDNGTWQVNGRTVYDAEQHGVYVTNVKRAFELSSNVGMAKLAYSSYANNPVRFINHLKNLGLDSSTGIDLYGERKPVMYKPGSRYWSATTLPWMAFGYNIAVTPLHTAMLYNAVANNGKMMKPYLLQSVQQDGIIIKQTQPVAFKEKICSDETLKQLKECLIGVCKDSGATAYKVFKGSSYQVAGKTGTALVANGSRGYGDHIYQSSFAGFFPADDPQYTCVVLIKNKPHAPIFYGALVAGPVFKEIADRLYTMFVKTNIQYTAAEKNDSINYVYAGTKQDIKNIMNTIGVAYKDSSGKNTQWAEVSKRGDKPVITTSRIDNKAMPRLTGMNLKDAVYVCENMGLKVNIKGKGKVVAQSLAQGEPVAAGQLISIQLN